MNINRQWLLARRPFGMVSEENFEYREAPIPDVGDGEVLVRNLYLSFDPTQRGWMEDRESYMPPVKIGEPMRAGSIGQVAESNHPEFATGDLVQALGGWQDFVVAKPAGAMVGLTRVPPGLDPAMMLSVLGTTGQTAYWGLFGSGQTAERRDRAGVRRGRRHRLRGRADRPHQGLPGDRHRRGA